LHSVMKFAAVLALSFVGFCAQLAALATIVAPLGPAMAALDSSQQSPREISRSCPCAFGVKGSCGNEPQDSNRANTDEQHTDPSSTQRRASGEMGC